MSKKFTRTKEDFKCEVCSNLVKGNGYTNHCPKCLWSKHVDINPGDREAACGGLMKPISGEKRGDEFIVNQECVLCGFVRKNTLSKDDDFDTFVALMKS